MACSGRNGKGTGSLDMYEKYTLPRERAETIKQQRHELWRLQAENRKLKRKLRGAIP